MEYEIGNIQNRQNIMTYKIKRINSTTIITEYHKGNIKKKKKKQ